MRLTEDQFTDGITFVGHTWKNTRLSLYKGIAYYY